MIHAYLLGQENLINFIQLPFDRLVENQALRHSDSIICHDCAFKASAGCKAV